VKERRPSLLSAYQTGRPLLPASFLGAYILGSIVKEALLSGLYKSRSGSREHWKVANL
jgi:hypothetical protein